MRLGPGVRVGPYEVVAPLGAGGMAEVYRARDTRLGRDIALKVVNEALAGDPELVRRFEQEARLAGSLNHPNVVAVYDVGLHEGTPFFVTELLQGESLRQRLSRGRIPLQTALDWAAQMAHGLAAAHARGVIHRDVKPDNVFIGSDGHVKLLDFGIAKLAEAARDGGPHGLLDDTVTPTGGATRTGSVLGTPGYMSPEQIRGESVDARTDIFSLGAVVYELLSGKRAFPGATLVESGHAILHDDPAPLPEGVPATVAQIVRRCLEKDREQRFQSARDVGFDFDAGRSASGGVPSIKRGQARVGGRRRGVLAFAAAAALGALVAAFVAGQRAERSGQLQARPLTFRRGSVLAARFAPDGRTVHYSAAWHGASPQVFSTTIDAPEARPLGIGDANLLAVSRSGELAVSVRPNFWGFERELGTLARVPSMGGRPRELASDVSYADWAPDGEQVAVARFEGDEGRLEFPLGKVLFRSTGWVSHPRVSPRGDQVAFVDHDVPASSSGQVRVVNTDGSVETWSPHFDTALGLAWTSGGTELLVSGAFRAGEFTSLWILRRKQEPRLFYRAPGNLLLADASPDGRLLVVAYDWRQEVEVWTGDGRNLTPEWPVGYAILVGLSDDGNTVLTNEYSTAPGLQSVVSLWDRRQSVSVRIGKGRPLALSHDGHWALVEEVDFSGKLVLLPTGPDAPKVLGDVGLAFIRSASFFSDGRRVALVGRSRPDKPMQVWVLDLEGGKAGLVSAETVGASYVAVSPDQRWLAVSQPDGIVTAYSLEGAEPIRVEAWGSTHDIAGWLEDGTLLAYEWAKVPSRVDRFDPRSRTVRPFITLAPTDIAGVQRIRVKVTPDGRTLAFDAFRSTGTLNLLEWKRSR